MVERDGLLTMVDDDRLPIEPDQIARPRMVRFRTLGCYPLTGAIESGATTMQEIIQEMLIARTSEPRARHRSRRGGVDGEKEARAVFLDVVDHLESNPYGRLYKESGT